MGTFHSRTWGGRLQSASHPFGWQQRPRVRWYSAFDFNDLQRVCRRPFGRKTAPFPGLRRKPRCGTRGMERMSEMYVVGGALRSSLFKQLPEWNSYKKALIAKVKPEAKTSEVVVEYVSPEDVCPADAPAILFKSATMADDKLYVCTPTEVLVYQLPSFELLHYVSLPCFNDLHHVRPTPDGNILIVDTGLDLVLELTPRRTLLRACRVSRADPRKPSSPVIANRTVPCT